MKSKIFNVSLTRKKTNLSYPIIVGDDLLSNGGEILKEFIYKKKLLLYTIVFFLLIANTIMCLGNLFSLYKN